MKDERQKQDVGWGFVFDRLMHEYGYKIEYLRGMTRPMMFLLMEQIGNRIGEDMKFEAKLHGAYQEKGLKLDNAIAIEDILDGNNKLLM